MEPFACHRKQRSATAACNIYLIKKRKVMWIDYQLHIYFIYIYIFLFSRSLTQLLLRTRTFIPLALIYFCLQCNKTGDRPEITITKNKLRK